MLTLPSLELARLNDFREVARNLGLVVADAPNEWEIVIFNRPFIERGCVWVKFLGFEDDAVDTGVRVQAATDRMPWCSLGNPVVVTSVLRYLAE